MLKGTADMLIRGVCVKGRQLAEGLIVYLARESDSVRKRVRAAVAKLLVGVFWHRSGRNVDLKILMWSWRRGGYGCAVGIALSRLGRV